MGYLKQINQVLNEITKTTPAITIIKKQNCKEINLKKQKKINEKQNIFFLSVTHTTRTVKKKEKKNALHS